MIVTCPRCRKVTLPMKESEFPFQCVKSCGFVAATPAEMDSGTGHVALAPPRSGVGTELTAIFKELGIKPTSSCNCNQLAANMDKWGVEGCRGEHRSLLLCSLQKAYGAADWKQKVSAGFAAIAKGLPLTLEGVLDEGIRRAEVKDAWQPIRNCIYHVAPLAKNDLWQKNVAQLLKRSAVFTGKKIAAIATGDGILPPAVVREAFSGHGFTFLEIPNDRQLREVVTFLPLLQSVASVNPSEVTFYAHTKGNGTAESVKGARRWANSMYHHLLDDWERVRRFLLSSPMAGTHKMEWPGDRSPYPSRLKHGQWMYSGTFYWFRHDRVFNHPKWAEIPNDRYGAEAWPSGLFDAKEVLSVWQPWGANEKHPNPYTPELYPAEFDDVP